MIVLIYQIALGFALLAICIYLFFELHYFLRSLVCVILAKCKKKVYILEETSMNGICLTTDIDNLFTHMNNARFLRELDFAKIDFFERSGLFRLIKKHKGSLCLGATTVRYRRFIRLFSLYKITSKIIYWDNLSIYMEHRFINSDNFVSAIVMCRTRIANCDVEVMMAEALKIPEGGDIEHAKRNEKPELTQVLRKWIEHNELSSAMLRSTKEVEDVDGGSDTNGEKSEVNGNMTTMKEIRLEGCTNLSFNDKT